jgi:hypothetical protein
MEVKLMEIYDYVQKQPKPLPPIGSDLGYSYKDSYEYSPNDSWLWLELFIITDKCNRELAKQLEIIRATGAIFIIDNHYGFIIQPVIDPAGQKGWKNIEQYNEERKYLMPYSNLLIESLKQLRIFYEKHFS